MTILVIGGAGYIGTHAVQALLAKTERRVAILDDFSSGSFSNLEQLKKQGSVERLIVEVGTALDEQHLQELCERHSVTVVVDCTVSDKAAVSLAVTRLARTVPIKAVVMVSTAAVYAHDTMVADERSPTNTSQIALDYLEAEKNYALLAKDGMVRTVALRFGNVIGAMYAADLHGDVRVLSDVAKVKDVFWLRPVPGPRNYIHVSSAADVITEAALHARYKKVVNVAAQLTMTETEFATLWMKVTGKFVDMKAPSIEPTHQTLSLDLLEKLHGKLPPLSQDDVWQALVSQELMYNGS